jgi:Delta serrate ligand
VSGNWTQYFSRAVSKEVTFEYRVTCAQNYYGPGCEALCRERDDNFGHIACSASGQKICLSGWQGEYCTERKCFSSLSLLIIIRPRGREGKQFCLALFTTSFRFYYNRRNEKWNRARETSHNRLNLNINLEISEALLLFKSHSAFNLLSPAHSSRRHRKNDNLIRWESLNGQLPARIACMCNADGKSKLFNHRLPSKS